MVLIDEKRDEHSPFSVGSTYVNSPSAPQLPPASPTPSEPIDLTQMCDYEFENVRGDLFLVSSDNDSFRVTSAILFEVAPFLKKIVNDRRMRFNITSRSSNYANPNDMFASMVSFQDNDMRFPTLTFPDIDSRTLVLILNTIYPVSHRQTLSTLPFLDFQLISSLFLAGTKYQIPPIVETARRGLHPTAGPTQIELYKNGPNTLKAFVFARVNGMKEETLLAARETLKFPHPLILPGEYMPELETLTAGDYHRLAGYHSRVAQKVQALFALPEPDVNSRIQGNFRFGPHPHPTTFQASQSHCDLMTSLTSQVLLNARIQNPPAGASTNTSTTLPSTTVSNNSGSTSGNPAQMSVEGDEVSLFKRYPSLLGCFACANVYPCDSSTAFGTVMALRHHPYAHNHHQHPIRPTNGSNVRRISQTATAPSNPAHWWTVYAKKVLPIISRSPLTDEIFSIGFLKETFMTMTRCSECSESNDAFKNFEEVVGLIKEERESLVNEVTLDFAW